MSRSTVPLDKLIDDGLVRRGHAAKAFNTADEKAGHPANLDFEAGQIPEDFGRSLHLIESGECSGDAAAAGFLVSYLTKSCSRHAPVLWVTEVRAEREAGRLYGPGLSALAFDPGAFMVVRAQRTRDVLWAMEEGLRSGAVHAVVGEMDKPGPRLDLTATRRLALRSERAGVPAYVLVANGEGVGATAARSRSRIQSAPAPTSGRGLLGPPSWSIAQIKNKKGPCRTAAIAYDPARLAYTTIERTPPPPTYRPRLPNGNGAIVVFPRAATGERGRSA